MSVRYVEPLDPALDAEGVLGTGGGAVSSRLSATRGRVPEANEILTPEDVAGVLSIPRKTVVSLCANERLEGAFKAGRQWRIPGWSVRKMVGFSDGKGSKK